ncbi:GcrA family cell cycle regulator [Methylobrevis pamukkalensis]|uniref:GcrA cell cycle regulator n=1 Tax=Methylobrevis pamukkalensis TaxID=1439726 RepID=A0A1E3H0L7_9HYPH|nr:GcrA family cell cycle regulator [Methylobrevis pamukkalensis]ODN69832.1 GcrA cell cycle regulator [Methylobrevis pamukkalensis]
MTELSWTDERVERLKTLWAEGLSASQIAAELSGVTRNAVIGKVHRLGLSGRAKPQNQVAGARPRKAREPSHPMRPAAPITIGNLAVKAEPEAAPEAKAKDAPVPEVVAFERATILTLTEQTCKWPIGDPSRDDFFFCGRRSDVGIPYCAHHARIAYQPAHDRRQRKAS